MGIKALTHRDGGSQVPMPVSQEDWMAWVSAGQTRNYMMKDPLLDWLRLYGRDLTFLPRMETEAYNKDLDFTQFIFERAQASEAGILDLLQARYEVVTIAKDQRDIRDLNKAIETFDTMAGGAPLLYQPVLFDAHHQTYGAPDVLVRSDVLEELFPSAISAREARIPAPALGGHPWHYRVVDVKYTTLHLVASGGELANQGGSPAYKAQLHIYNRMLGRLQDYLPPSAYLLGRGWERRRGREVHRGSNALELLAHVPQTGTLANKVPIEGAVEEAIAWVRQVRTHGKTWALLPFPEVPELYPNMSNADDGDMAIDLGAGEADPVTEGYEPPDHWTSAKKWLAAELGELTLLWRVGVAGREAAHANGLLRWDDTGLTPQDVKVTGGTYAPTLAKVLQANVPGGAAPVLPARVETARDEWHPKPLLEFFVDFEFCSDLADDFSQLPEKGGQPLIFMVGCGHVENGIWQFCSFITDRLTEQEELRIIGEWTDHMKSITARLAPGTKPRLIHWSNAEVTALETSYNSVRARHGKPDSWPGLNWYDFLAKVIRREPVAVRGALSGFGLKSIANSLHGHGLIQTSWDDSPIDGLGAMVGAWRCDEEAERQGIAMSTLPLMAEITKYNEIDCKVMMEILQYLRANH